MLLKIAIISCLTLVVKAQKGEGDRCTLDGYPGRCVDVKRCMYVLQIIKDKKSLPICSFKGATPLVCCTDCDLVDDINEIVVDNARGPLFKNGRKAWDYCLDNIKQYSYPCKQHYSYTFEKVWNASLQCHLVVFIPVAAVGGRDVQRGEYPIMGLLGYGSQLSSLQWLCGASIISDRFLLTAAHCVSSPEFGPVTYAGLGMLKRSDPEHYWRRYRIQRTIPHPEYSSPSKYHDIALLRTAETIQFFDHVLPACLPMESPKYRDQRIALGWGALGHRRELADNLQLIVIEEFPEEDCSALYRPHRHLRQGYNATTQMCSGDKVRAIDTCPGDSGGPLLYSRGCSFDVVGVTSYGQPCGFVGSAGMYTRVMHYVPWIEAIVWP